MTQVLIRRRERDTMLIEWQDENEVPKRAWVPSTSVTNEAADGTADVENPQEGIPDGLEWQRVVRPLTPIGRRIEIELKRRGIWTNADLRANPNVARGAIQAAYGIDIATLMRSAQAHEENEGD